MIFSIVLAFLLAKLHKYKLRPVFHCIWLLPFLAVELAHYIFQLAAWNDNYIFLPYASTLKSAYLYVLIVPVIVYRLYTPSLFGAASILFGTMLNNIVIHANGGKMPVYPSLSKVTGYFDTFPLGTADTLHCLGSADTKLKWLTDFIDVGFGILSIGDLFVHAFTAIILFYTIKALNVKEN